MGSKVSNRIHFLQTVHVSASFQIFFNTQKNFKQLPRDRVANSQRTRAKKKINKKENGRKQQITFFILLNGAGNSWLLTASFVSIDVLNRAKKQETITVHWNGALFFLGLVWKRLEEWGWWMGEVFVGQNQALQNSIAWESYRAQMQSGILQAMQNLPSISVISFSP